MKKEVLPNGLTLIYKKRKGPSVVVEVMIRAGSNDEVESERGISHFLEHILFEGTKKRPTNRDITNEIEKIGGDFNAYTTNERTCFHIKVLKKNFLIAIEILADIMQNSLFKLKDIEREKNVVIKEIELVNDEPRFYQWILFQKNLFSQHPARHPTYGSKTIISNLTREKILNYFSRYYQPNNMVISIVGDVDSCKKEIRKRFTLLKHPVVKNKPPIEPPAGRNTEKREKRKIANTYAVLGFKTVPRTHKDAYVLEVVNGILGRGQSGRMFSEIRAKKGLAYDVGTQHIAETSYGYFAIYATIDRKNLSLVKKVILRELKKLKKLSEKDLQEAKDSIEGNYSLELEDPQKMADQILFWEQAGKAELMDNFIKEIKKIRAADIRRVVDKYFKNYTLTVVEGK